MNGLTLASMAPLPVWVAWQARSRNDRVTKIPYCPHSESEAKADDPSTWGTRDAAEKRAATLPKPLGMGGIGIEFTRVNDTISHGGIDLDTCRDPTTGAIDAWAQEIVDTLASYTEVSPSQTGLKIFVAYRTTDLQLLRTLMGGAQHSKIFKRGKGDHPPSIEVHLSNRYFAVTDLVLPGSTSEIRLIDTATLRTLIEVTGPAFAAAAKQANDPKPTRQGPADRSRSATAFRKGRDLRRGGATYEEMVAALLADPETAEWAREKGQAANQRELKRIWTKAEANGPVIKIQAGELHTATTAAEDALIASRLPLFQRGRDLVQPIQMEVPASRGRMTRAAALGSLTIHSAIDLMCGTAHYEKYDSRSEDWVRINPPTQLAQILLSRAGKWRFASIAGVITTPTLRPDGTLLIDHGYDPATRIYHLADPSLRLHPHIHQPTRDLAERALGFCQHSRQPV